MPNAPAFETAAAKGGTAAMGACTIGRSVPSISQSDARTGVTRAVILRRPLSELDQRLSVGHSYDDGIESADRRFQPWNFA